jgi:hypothetical protein
LARPGSRQRSRDHRLAVLSCQRCTVGGRRCWQGLPRWRRSVGARHGPAKRDRHVPTAPNLTLVAHGHWKRPVPWHYPEMGHLVAGAGNRDRDELTSACRAMLVEGLGVPGPACTLPQAQVTKAKGRAAGKAAGTKPLNTRRVQHLPSRRPAQALHPGEGPASGTAPLAVAAPPARSPLGNGPGSPYRTISGRNVNVGGVPQRTMLSALSFPSTFSKVPPA